MITEQRTRTEDWAHFYLRINRSTRHHIPGASQADAPANTAFVQSSRRARRFASRTNPRALYEHALEAMSESG